jgi:hypothetical protein
MEALIVNEGKKAIRKRVAKQWESGIESERINKDGMTGRGKANEGEKNVLESIFKIQDHTEWQ